MKPYNRTVADRLLMRRIAAVVFFTGNQKATALAFRVSPSYVSKAWNELKHTFEKPKVTLSLARW